ISCTSSSIRGSANEERMSTAPIIGLEPGLAAEVPPPTTRRGGFLWQVLKERPTAAAGAVVVVAFILIALLAPYIAPYGLPQRVGPVFGVPSAQHCLGLDVGG